MNYGKILADMRERKSRRIQRREPDRLLSVRDICQLLSAEIPSGIDPDKKFSMICCFEGVFLKDCLFVNHERFRDNVPRAAMRRGAAAILSTHQIDDYPCILVDNILDALVTILKPYAEQVRVPVVVITGSIGKTTTKYFVNCVFSTQGRTFCNITNGNSFEYVGFELQRYDRKAMYFIQEVNESDPGCTRSTSKVMKPSIAIITNMDKSHIGELGSEENIIRSICEITDGMGDDGVVIINADDPNSQKASFRHKTISVGIRDTSADCVASNIKCGANQIEFDVAYDGRKTCLSIPVTGMHNVYDAMMAFVAGSVSGIPEKDIRKGLSNYRPLGYRQNMFRTSRNTIYADCYNASARSIRSALEVLKMQPRKEGARKIAILGDIGEIDGYKEDIYSDVAKSVSESDVDILITFGTDMATVCDRLSRQMETYRETTMEGLCNRISSIKKKDDIFLFKASRSMRLELAMKKTFPYAYLKGMLPVYAAYGNWTLKTL